MIWIVWLLLCAGPAAIAHFKVRPPLTFFGIALGFTFGLYLIGWGFMSLTGAPMHIARLSGKVLGFLGLAAAYVVAVMSNASETGEDHAFWRKKREIQCPNCAGFISKDDDRCPHCRFSLR